YEGQERTTPIFSTAARRKLLQDALPADSDLDAFCLQHFPEIQSRFSNAMDRTAKLNLLLQHSSEASIMAALSHKHAELIMAHAHESLWRPGPKAAALPAATTPAASAPALAELAPPDAAFASSELVIRPQRSPVQMPTQHSEWRIPIVLGVLLLLAL